MDTQTYIIEDIHPEDAFYDDRKSLIGKQVSDFILVETPLGDDWGGLL